MAVYKSSFTRALKPNVLNKYMIEMLCCILISISVLIASVQKNIFFQDLKYSVVSFSKPFIFSIAKPFEYFNNFLLYIGDLKSAHDQNKVLKKQNHEFRILLNEKDFYEIENHRLKKILELESKDYTKKLVGRILIDPYARPNSSLTIDLGKKDGLKINDIVFNENGMIGRIEELGETSSKVLMLLNENSVIPVISKESKKSFFVQGDVNQLKIKHLENSGSLLNNEVILTTDAAGYFKSGIIVGHVNKNNDEIIIQPIAKKSDSIYVSVLVYDFRDFVDW